MLSDGNGNEDRQRLSKLRETLRGKPLGPASFAKEKARDAELFKARPLDFNYDRNPKPWRNKTMEYLILAAVGSMMALYALIIIGCLRQPEW